MPKTSQAKRRTNFILSGWAGAGFAIGFACGYVTMDSWVSGIILGLGLALAMGMAGKTTIKKG